MVALTVKDLAFSYRSNGANSLLYSNFSLSIEKNKVTALMGPSGCGKSTLGRLIGGTLTPQSGRIEWDGEFADERHRFYVHQDPDKVLYPQQIVRENVIYPLNKCKVPRHEAQQQADRILEEFGLTDKWNEYPRDLSGGEKSRLALAKVLIWNPKAVILDECLSGLDVHTRDIILGVLERRADKGDTTTLFITHTLHEVLRIANRCIVLGNHPVQIRDDIDIPLDYPRDEKSQEYQDLHSRLLALLRNEI